MGLTIALVDSGEGQFGNLRYQIADVTFDSSYPTGGEPLPTGTGGTPSVGGIQNVLAAIDVGVGSATAGGVVVRLVPSTGKMMAFRVTGTGTVAAPTFTGTAQPVVNNTPVFTGTGLTAAGQVLTSTDNQTMTLNQCAGMILISATGNASVEIVSNTAVAGAPAVFTVVGKATTDAGAYKVFTGPTPAGTNSAPAFTGTAASLTEVAAAQSLASIVQRFMFLGI